MKYKIGDWFFYKKDKRLYCRICGYCGMNSYTLVLYHPNGDYYASENYSEAALEHTYEKFNRLEVLVLFGEV